MKELTGLVVAVEPSDVIEGRVVGEDRREMSYEEACFSAALEQGLAPISLRLSLAGIPHNVVQTGGFCMAVMVPLAGDRTIGIICDKPPGWLLVLYDDNDEDGEEHPLASSAPTERVLDLIREHGGPRKDEHIGHGALEPTP